MANPTSSHPKIVVSEYNRTSTDSLRRTSSSSSSTTHKHVYGHPHHEDQENNESHHPGTRVHESEIHGAYEDEEGKDEELETVRSMEEESRKRKRDYALQLSRAMGKQLVAGISKGSRAEAKERVRRNDRERAGVV